MNRDADWFRELQRYTLSHPLLKEQSIWVVWVYRFGRRADRRPNCSLKRLLPLIYWLLFRTVETVLGGVRLGNGCKIGAMSVVLSDVPDGATAVGVPARIIPPSSKT
ncbi:MAG: hypothetical protein ACYCSS_09725 [Sulfuriferula sp.]